MINLLLSRLGKGFVEKDSTKFHIPGTPLMSVDIESTGQNKKPGDCAYYSGHGVAGIAVGNMKGDAGYLVVNDGRDYGATPIHMAMTALNRILAQPEVTSVMIYYSKFDLGFLLARGLNLGKLRLIDPWLLRNIKSCGVFQSNKLKELMRAKFQITTDSEKLIKDWMAANNTEDYGDIPLEMLGLYAADDVVYSLLAFLSEADVTQADWANHDLYIKNTLHVIGAEARGVYVDIPKLKGYLETATTQTEKKKLELRAALGEAAVDLDDEQALMRYLHDKNLHSAPREKYGELVYDFDRDFLLTIDHPIAKAFYWYHRYKTFVQCFSGARGEMGPRIFFDTSTAGGFHLQHLLSTFSKGGIVQCKQPDFADRLTPLTTELRQLFVPRPSHAFVLCRAVDLPLTLLAYYSQSMELQAAVRHATQSTQPGGNALEYLTTTAGFQNQDAVSLLLRQAIEGSGFERLMQRLTGAGVKGIADKKVLYNWRDKFVASIPGFAQFKTRLEASVKQHGQVSDRLGRVLKIQPDSYYRAHSILIGSSNGSILSFYLDVFCRIAASTGAQLVLAHEKEFLFEVPENKLQFYEACQDVTQRRLIDPHPCWDVTLTAPSMQSNGCWRSHVPDSHEVANHEK